VPEKLITSEEPLVGLKGKLALVLSVVYLSSFGPSAAFAQVVGGTAAISGNPVVTGTVGGGNSLVTTGTISTPTAGWNVFSVTVLLQQKGTAPGGGVRWSVVDTYRIDTTMPMWPTIPAGPTVVNLPTHPMVAGATYKIVLNSTFILPTTGATFNTPPAVSAEFVAP
jgi:hypothetical protein